MPTGYISVGSNIQREQNIASSLTALKQNFGELRLSSIYEAEAVGFKGDAFLNLVVEFNTNLAAKEVAKILRQIELDHGRTRDSQKFSARTLDLDLILFGDLVIDEGSLQIPRNEIERYAFVLEPLAEIVPNLQHPISHKTYGTLWQDFNKTDLQQKRLIEPARLSTV